MHRSERFRKRHIRAKSKTSRTGKGANMKKKLWLLGICIAAILIIFVGNVIRQLKESNDTEKVNTPARAGEIIKTAEAQRLLASLGVKTEEADTDQENELTFKEARSYLALITETLNLTEKDITDKLTYSLSDLQDGKKMRVSEFLGFYQAVLDSIEAEELPVTEKEVYILGSREENDSEVIITDAGEFNLKNAVSYEEYYKAGKLTDVEDTITGGSEGETGHKLPATKTVRASDYTDMAVTVLIKGKDIIYIKETSDKEWVLSNLWIISGKDNKISTYVNGFTKDFLTEYPLSEEIENTISNVTVKNKKIIRITMKPDTIKGKVLSAGKNSIEIQGYGKVPLEDGYKIYKIYGDLSMEVTNSILVGYSTTDFVVADGKIAAALITEPIRAENIRVLIKTDNFNGIFHDQVVLTANKDFTVTAGKTVKKHKAGDKVTIKTTNKLFNEGRLLIETQGENGKITILSVNRSGGNPKYRGNIEVAKETDGLTIVNELSMEEYLYAVIPSEMPTSYNMEALKAQAVCARSYAYNQLMAGALSEYGAQVDDSVSYQVYNNLPENEQSILAVKDTYGKVIKYDAKVIDAYYFSTSWGHTASLKEVWGSDVAAPYLTGKAQAVYDLVDQKTVYAASFHPEDIDYSDETAFRSFLEKPEYDTYDSEFPWYRWKVTMTKDELTKTINQSLSSRYKANPGYILTLTGGTLSGNPIFESRDISTIGELTDIKIAARETSGVVSKIYLVGTKATVSVQSEYNIRSLLSPITSKIIRADDSSVSALKLLPSAYICFNKGEDKITIKGGGYGHGVGMSQNGAKAMADSGKTFDLILKHFYTGTEIGFIY